MTELLADYFPSEFLARLDDICLFNRLSPDIMYRIMSLRLDEALSDLRAKNITIVFDHARLLHHLLEGFKNRKNGARGIVRLLEQKLLDSFFISTFCPSSTNGRSLSFLFSKG